MSEEIEFTEEQRDAAEELLNIGMGKAAAALSRMLGEELELTVPSVELATRDRAIERYQIEGVADVAAVRQDFRGPFDGQAMLLFPRAESLQLVRMLIGEESELESITELEQDALTEVGNVVLNGCLGCLANLLSGEFNSDSPLFAVARIAELLKHCHASTSTVFLMAEIGFSLRSRSIRGTVVFALPLGSLENFRASVSRLLA